MFVFRTVVEVEYPKPCPLCIQSAETNKEYLEENKLCTNAFITSPGDSAE